jgi:hypothetical protein
MLGGTGTPARTRQRGPQGIGPGAGMVVVLEARTHRHASRGGLDE